MHLINFQYRRTGKQAFGFYISYFLLGSLSGGLVAGIYGLVTGANDFHTGIQVGGIFAIILVLGLSITITLKKEAVSFKTIFIILISGILALLLGCLGGLIATAYLTTIENKENNQVNLDA